MLHFEKITLNDENYSIIEKLHLKCSAEIAKTRPDLYTALDEEAEKTYLNELFSRKTFRCIAVYENEKIIGYIQSMICHSHFNTYFVKFPYAYIFELYIIENYRRHGFATILLEKELKYYKQNGIQNIELYVLGNNSAVGLYEKFGFKPQSLIMECKL